jgi:hypothetical protein
MQYINIENKLTSASLLPLLPFVFFLKKVLKFTKSCHRQPDVIVVTKFSLAARGRRTSLAIRDVQLWNSITTIWNSRESLVRLRELNRGHNLRNPETDLALPKPKTNFLKRSFKYSASMLWNNLSLDAKRATSLSQFKHI